MRRAAERLALFFLAIQISRVADFVYALAPARSTWYLVGSYLFAAGIAYGVYLSFFYVRQPKVRWSSWAGVIVFGGLDLFFNEFEIIRTVSAKQLIAPQSSFAWISGEFLQNAIQVAALVYGAAPTLASAVLGWMQGGINKVTDQEFGTITIGMRLQRSFASMFNSISLRAAAAVEVTASRVGGSAEVRPSGMPVVDGVVTPKKWHELTAEDIAFISASNRPSIMARFGTSDGGAGKWIKRVRQGDRPWKDAEKPPKVLAE